MIALQTFGFRNQAAAPPRPTVIGLINLEKMYSSLNEQNDAIKQLEAVRQELQTTKENLEKEAKDLEEEVALFAKGSAKQMETLEKLTVATVKLQAHVEFANAKMEFQESIQLKKLYLQIRAKGAKFAKLNGYDMILLDDSIGELPTGDAVETTRQISARRVIYADPVLDVTDRLVEFMNAEHQLAQGAGPAGATP
jgi:Skp family chaperone for outer membrane proteins